MEKGETLEALACGGLSILQKRDGYRFSQDAYLLAAFVDEKPETAVLEIGSGSGVVAILLAGIKRLSLTGVEVQEDLAAMSRRAVEMNGLGQGSESWTGRCSRMRDPRSRPWSPTLPIDRHARAG